MYMRHANVVCLPETLRGDHLWLKMWLDITRAGKNAGTLT